MSEQEQEQTQEQAPEEAPDAEPSETPAEAEPSEQEQAGEEEEAQESGQVEGVPPEAQAVSQKQIEQVHRKFEKSSEVWRKRVDEIMGGDIDVLLPCPMCDSIIPGYLMPTPDIPERFPAVRAFMGDAPLEEYEPLPDAHRCEVCKGRGMGKTDSLVSGQERLVCLACDGRGWVGPRAQKPALVTPPPALVAEGNGPVASGPSTPDPPEVAALKRQGYTIIEPVR